jgi:hypothetical protein
MLTKNSNPAILWGEPWKHTREGAVLPTTAGERTKVEV